MSKDSGSNGHPTWRGILAFAGLLVTLGLVIVTGVGMSSRQGLKETKAAIPLAIAIHGEHPHAGSVSRDEWSREGDQILFELRSLNAKVDTLIARK